jgi:hypothetical protein
VTTPAARSAAAEAAQFVLRQVDAAVIEVGLHVAHDVGELQGDPEVHRVVAPARMAAAEDVQADEPDRRGHAPAVLAQIIEGVVAAMAEIHLHAVDEVFE